MASAWIEDVRYAFNALRRLRVLSAVSITTLAIGIGAVTAIFSVIDAVLIRSVPFPQASRLVVIWQRDPSDPSRIGEVSHYTYRLWQGRSHELADLAAFGSVNWSFELTGRGERRAVPFAAVSWTFFRALGIAPMHGRIFAEEDDRPHAAPVVIVSYGFWKADLGGDRAIIGRPLLLNGTARTVVGVMPPDFDFPRGASMWAPVTRELASVSVGAFQALEAPGFGVLYLVGRLRGGATASRVATELADIDRQDAAAHGFTHAQPFAPVLTSLRDYVSENSRPALVALGGTCVAILLIACMNVSSLLLMRVSSSRRLFAIRTALGASRGRIIREELSLAVLLSAAGTIGGVLLSLAGLRIMLALMPPGLPLLETVRVDWRAIVCAVLALLTAVLASGLAPAARAGTATSSDVLVGRVTAGLSTTSLRNILVTIQAGAAAVLLLLAALSIQSLRHVHAIDLGFDMNRLATLNASIPDSTPGQRQQFSHELLASIRAMPDVASAGAVSLRPLEHGSIGMDMSFLLEGQRPFPALDGASNPVVVEEVITPHYFETMGTALVAGRDFDDHDVAATRPVIIVSDGLARALWPGQDPIGKRLQLADAPVDANGTPRWSTVVGVVGDIRYRGVTDPRPDLYVPYSQSSEPVPHVMIRTRGPAAPLLGPVRDAASRIHPAATVNGLDTMAAVVSRATAAWTFNMWLFSLLGLVGLGLAATGLYGLLAYLVSERTREMGVRLALGAAPRQLAVAILARGLRLTTSGLVAGLAAAAALARFAEHLAYEVRPLDSVLVVVVSLVLLITAGAASYLPARRATAIDPAVALRQE